MSGKTHPRYPEEFKTQAVRLARTSGQPVKKIALEIGCSADSLKAWLKQADIDEGIRSDGLKTEELEENRRLRRELRIVKEERDILKKAVGYFARETGPTQ